MRFTSVSVSITNILLLSTRGRRRRIEINRAYVYQTSFRSTVLQQAPLKYLHRSQLRLSRCKTTGTFIIGRNHYATMIVLSDKQPYIDTRLHTMTEQQQWNEHISLDEIRESDNNQQAVSLFLSLSQHFRSHSTRYLS